jgi:hypothetical protein
MFNDLPYNQAGLLPALPTDMKPGNLPAFHYIKEKGDSTRFALVVTVSNLTITGKNTKKESSIHN